MARLYDVLSDADKAKVDAWAEERAHPKYETEIPPELYTIAEAGHYLGGWPAIEAVMRGYVTAEDEDGKPYKIRLTTGMVIGLCKAERKLRHHALVASGDMSMRADIAARCKNPGTAFEKMTKQYRKED